MAHTFKITVTDEEYKAFNLIVPDADAWVDNAVREKIRKCMIYVTEAIARDTSLLDPTDLQEVEALIAAEGSVMKPPKDWSNVVKGEIAKRTKMKSRKVRDIEDLPQ